MSLPRPMPPLAALAMAVGLGLLSAPAAVSQTARTLISNIGQLDQGGGLFNLDLGTLFTTGGHPQGYRVTSVSLQLSVFQPVATVSLGIRGSITRTTGPDRIHASEVIGTLSNPASRAPGVNTFNAPAGGIHLEPNTEYAVVLDTTNGQTSHGNWTVTTSSVDPSPATGWSLGRGLYRAGGSTDGFIDWSPRKIRIRGYAVSPPSALRSAKPKPSQLALWTDKPGYRAAETVRLYYTIDPHDDAGRYRTFVYLERAYGGERRYLSALIAGDTLHDEPVDVRGLPARSSRPRALAAADRELAWEGPAPSPGLWQFVLELRPGAPREEPAAHLRARRVSTKFAVAERSQLLNRRGFDREIRDDLTLRSDTLYYLGHQLFVHDGATLTIEPGTLVQAWGHNAAIIVEPGGRIVAEGTREAPVVLTCSVPVGRRLPGCWGGLRILGRAPVTRLEGVAPGVLPAARAVYGGSDAASSSGVLRHVRVEFAGAAADREAGVPAIGLYGAGSGTVLDHVQARASLGDGFAFRGGAAVCDHCVASGSGSAGLSWERGWRGGASHLYVQQGRAGLHGLVGGHDEEGHDLEPRSSPVLSNVTLIHAAPFGRRGRRALALQLSDGTAVLVRDLLATRFGRGAIRAAGRSLQLFGEGESSVGGALLYRNGSPQVPGGLADAVEFVARDPNLRDVRDFANPDPRPKPSSPALPNDREGYIGAFGREDNWLQEWTVFGPESVYDTRQRDSEGN